MTHSSSVFDQRGHFLVFIHLSRNAHLDCCQLSLLFSRHFELEEAYATCHLILYDDARVILTDSLYADDSEASLKVGVSDVAESKIEHHLRWSLKFVAKKRFNFEVNELVTVCYYHITLNV